MHICFSGIIELLWKMQDYVRTETCTGIRSKFKSWYYNWEVSLDQEFGTIPISVKLSSFALSVIWIFDNFFHPKKILFLTLVTKGDMRNESIILRTRFQKLPNRKNLEKNMVFHAHGVQALKYFSLRYMLK